MKLLCFALGLIVLICLSASVNAYDSTFFSWIGFGGNNCSFNVSPDRLECQHVDITNRSSGMNFLLQYTGRATLELKMRGYNSASYLMEVECLNFTDGVEVWTSSAQWSGFGGVGWQNPNSHTLTINSNTGVCRFKPSQYNVGIVLYLTDSNITYLDYTMRNYSAGGLNLNPFIALWGDSLSGQETTCQVNGEDAIISSTTNKSGYYIEGITPLCSTSAGANLFKFMNYKSSNPETNQEYYQHVYINPVEDLNISSFYPAEENQILWSVGDTMSFMATPSIQDTSYKLTWLVDYSEVDTGGLDNNIFVYSPTTEGKHRVQMQVYDGNCGRGVYASWWVYVNPPIVVSGKLRCNGLDADQVSIIEYDCNTTGLHRAYVGTDGTYTINGLRAEVCNVSVSDRDYLPFNTSVNISYPVWIENPDLIEIRHEWELEKADITTNYTKYIKTDTACNQIYNVSLSGANYELLFYPIGSAKGVSVLSIAGGTLVNVDETYVLAYAWDDTKGNLNYTLTAGDYEEVASVPGYFDLYKGGDEYRFSWVVNYYSSLEPITPHNLFFIDNECSSPASVEITTRTYNASEGTILPYVDIGIYDSTGAYNSSVKTNSTGQVRVNLTAKYWTFKASKPGYQPSEIRTFLIDGWNFSITLMPDALARNLYGLFYECGTNNAGIKDVDVYVYNSSGALAYNTKTDETGNFIFYNIPEGRYTLKTYKYSYANYTENILISGMNYPVQECLTRDSNFCAFKILVLNSDNESMANIDVSAYKHNDGSNTEIDRKTSDVSGYVDFYLPKRVNVDGVELGYNFRLDGLSDSTSKKAYYCRDTNIKKTINSAYDIPFSQGGVLDFLSNYGFGLFLIILLLFVAYVGKQFLNGIIGK